MAVGTPVFAFDCGNLAELVGEGGRVSPEGDIDGLAESVIGYLCSDDVAQESVRRSARSVGGRFAEDVLAERLAVIWREVGNESRVPDGTVNP